MAKRNIQANITIGAALSSSVASAFGGLQSKIAGLKADTAKLAATKKDVEAFSRALSKQDAARSRLNSARKGGVVGDVAKARAAFEKQTASVEKLRASLKAAGVDTRNLSGANEQLARSMANVGARIGSLGRLGTTLGGLKSKLQGVGTAFGKVGTSLGNMRNTLVGAGLGLGAVGYGFKTQFIDRAAAFEKYRIQLKAFGDDSEKALSWSEQFAMETPLNLDQVVQSYVKLRQQGIDPTDGTLQALVDSVAKVGGEFYDLEEIISQLGQAWRKEKLTMEDVKPLMNRGIPVYDMLAKSMGKTTKEIMEMQTEGKLGRRAIQGLLFELGRWSKGTSKEMAGSWTGILGRMGDYWVKFTKLVMESGPFEYMKRQLEGILRQVESLERDGSLKKWAEETGAAILSFAKGAKSLAVEIWDNVKGVKDFVGGWGNLAKILVTIPFIPLIASVANLAAAMTSLGIATWAALGPWGLVIGGLGLMAGALWMNQDAVEDFIRELAPLRALVEGVSAAIDLSVSSWNSIVAAIEEGGTMWVNTFQRIIQTIDTLLAKLSALGSMSIGGFKLGDIGGAALDLNPLSAPARMAERGIRALMPAQNMPASGGKAGSVTNNVEVKIDARGADPEAIVNKFRHSLRTTPLTDTTGTLTPR